MTGRWPSVWASGAGTPGAEPLRNAAWVARCVGRAGLAPLSEADRAALAPHLDVVSFTRGTAIYREGETAAAAWIVQSGRLGLYAGVGADRVLLTVLRAGDVEGDLSILLGMVTPYGAEALEDAVCLRIGAAALLRLLDERPALARRWGTAIAGRLAASQRRLVSLLGMPLTQQVARVLLDEAVDEVVPYTQTTIAALLGARRPSINKVLKFIQRKGAISVSYGFVTITDRARLHKISNSLPERA